MSINENEIFLTSLSFLVFTLGVILEHKTREYTQTLAGTLLQPHEKNLDISRKSLSFRYTFNIFAKLILSNCCYQLQLFDRISLNLSIKELKRI